MVKDYFNGIPRLIAEGNNVLCNGVTYCNEVFLSKNDNEEYWQEVPMNEIPLKETYRYSELHQAVNILLGGEQ